MHIFRMGKTIKSSSDFYIRNVKGKFMKFTKMHGCGNDYIYVDGSKEHIRKEDKPELVRYLSDRHFGIGADGVIFINPSTEADFEMEMYNADGSRAEMCGNGIRCVAKYVYDKGLTDKKKISIISAGKIKHLCLTVRDKKVVLVKVNMGEPEILAENVPANLKKEYLMTCVSMGNPHAVVFVDDVEGVKIEEIGPHIENHDFFPNRTNVEFVKVLDENTVQMRVWERGTGETLACGTGACAAAVACITKGLTGEQVTVKLPGGDLEIFWDRKENSVFMTGPASHVFKGEVEI